MGRGREEVDLGPTCVPVPTSFFPGCLVPGLFLENGGRSLKAPDLGPWVIKRPTQGGLSRLLAPPTIGCNVYPDSLAALVPMGRGHRLGLGMGGALFIFCRVRVLLSGCIIIGLSFTG